MEATFYDDYIPNLIDSMMTNISISESNFMLIKHYNTFDLSHEYISELALTRNNAKFLYHSFNAFEMQGAYEPFLDWLTVLINEYVTESLDEFFEKCNVYKLHRPIFESYFEKGICKRSEELIIGEVAFEQKMIVNDIISMIDELSRVIPLVLVFNKIHAAGSSTIRIIYKLMDRSKNRNVAILATYNEICTGAEYVSKLWDRLIAKFEEHDSIIDWTLNTGYLKNDVNSAFKFNQTKLADYYKKLNNMYYLLVFDQADYYLDILYHKFEVEKVYVAQKYKFIFLELNAKVSMFQDKTSDALLYANGMRNIIEESDDELWRYKYYYIAAQIYMFSYHQDLARKNVLKCKEVCKKLNNNYYMFKVELLEFMIEFQGWRNIWLLNTDRDHGHELIEKCKQYNYENHIAYIDIYSFDNSPKLFSDINCIDVSLAHFYKGIQIGENLGNSQLLIDAYKKNVMLASTNGYYDVANLFYERCYEIVTADEDRYEEASIYNGMGYNCCTMEKYAKANEYYNRALLIFIELNCMDEVNETIYNMAINAILAQDYNTAENYLGICLRIIKIMKSNSVRVCNISKIYGLRAYCCFKQKVLYNCKTNMQYVEQFLGHIIEIEDSDMTDAHLWDDDLFLYYFVSALMDEHENKLEDAYYKMEKAQKYVDRSKGSEFFNLTPYSIHFSRICKKLGYYEQSDKILKNCINFCTNRGYIYKKNLAMAELEGKANDCMKWNLSFKGITMDQIIAKAVVAGMERDFKEQREEIDFLAIWQKIINNSDNSVSRTIDHSITTLKNNYNIDQITFIRMEDGKAVVRYDDSKYDINDEKVQYLCNYFNENRTEFSITRLDKGYVEHKELINNVFGFNSINTLICAPIFINEKLSGLFICCITIDMDWNYKSKRYVFGEDDVSILMMLFRQLMDSIDRIEARKKIEKINNELQFVNKRLKDVAVKDNLTGLFNRQGFHEELELQMNKACGKGGLLKLSFLYADLDNFKYYNDTFGHDVGDIILKGFSEIINDICSGRGYAVRYGGDEFILVIFSNERDEIEKAAKDIYAKLRERNGFEQIISQKLGKPVTIPQERHVSCSVGISDTVIKEGDISKQKIEETLKRADAMMYYVKKTTKHRYVFYGDVKEDVDKIISGEVKMEKTKR